MQQEATSGDVRIVKIKGTENPTDLATKFVTEDTLKKCVAKAGMVLRIAAWTAGVTFAAAAESPAHGAGTRCLGGALMVVDSQEREVRTGSPGRRVPTA